MSFLKLSTERERGPYTDLHEGDMERHQGGALVRAPPDLPRLLLQDGLPVHHQLQPQQLLCRIFPRIPDRPLSELDAGYFGNFGVLFWRRTQRHIREEVWCYG